MITKGFDMKILGYVFAASLLLAVLRMAVIAVLLVLAGLLLWGIYAKPSETFGLLILLLLFGLIDRQPLACVVVAGIGWVIVKIIEINSDRTKQGSGN